VDATGNSDVLEKELKDLQSKREAKQKQLEQRTQGANELEKKYAEQEELLGRYQVFT
jgi:flagellar motility protein MotE (MotC chaperone)